MPRELTCYCGSLGKVRADRGQEIHWVLAKFLSPVGPVGTGWYLNPPYFPGLECRAKKRQMQRLAPYPYWLPGPWSGRFTEENQIEKSKWKSLELLPTKRVNQKWCHLSGEIAEISATGKGLKRYRGGDSNHISIQLICLACAGYRWILGNGSELLQA